MAKTERDEQIMLDIDSQYLMEAEDVERRIEEEKKKLRRAVVHLQNTERKLKAARQAFAKNKNARSAARLEESETEMEVAVDSYKAQCAAVDAVFSSSEECANRYYNTYSELGKRRLAKKAMTRHERFCDKEQEAVSRISENSHMILSEYESEEAEREEAKASGRDGADYRGGEAFSSHGYGVPPNQPYPYPPY